MSKPTSTPSPATPQPASALKSSASAWARGPPSTAATPSQSVVNSTTASPSGTPQLNQAPLPSGSKDVSSSTKAMAGPSQSSSRPQHSRKSSLLAVGGNAAGAAQNASTSNDSTSSAKPMNISGRTNAAGINFGSVSNPNAELSSSPAANPTTGTHLASTDGVKSFGSVEAAEANNEDKSAILGRKPPQTGGPKFDVNKLFQMPAAAASSPVVQQARGYDAHGRPVQMGSAQNAGALAHPASHASGSSGRVQNGPMLNSQGSPAMSNQNPRSPTMSHQQTNNMSAFAGGPGPAAFRPSNIQAPQGRGPPNQMAGGAGRGQPSHAFGMHPSQQHGGPAYPGMPYGPQGYYAYGYYGADSPYGPGPGQWQPAQGSTPLSPRAGNSALNNGPSIPQLPASGSSPSAGLPVTGTPTNRPAPSHNTSNFSTSSQTSGPSTPAQNHARPVSFQPGQPFTPGHLSSPSANLHASANAFVPRTKSSAIKITRADGTAVDLASAAKELKTPTPTGTPAVASAPATPGTPVPASKPSLPAMPVVVRMETEAQKAKRLSDQEEEKQRKAVEAKEEAERRDRETARKDKEEKEEKARQEAENEKKKAEEARRVAQEEADAQAAADKSKEEEKNREQAEQAQKQREDEADQKKDKEEEDARKAEADAAKESSARAESESDVKVRSTAGLPAKPSAEVLESARASPAPSALAPPSEGKTSNAPSPVASPSLSHATLPAKPAVAGSGFARKGAPTALSLPSAEDGSEPAQQANASAQALLTARPIEKLEDIRYPEGLQSPNVELNTGAQPGKFRYDRDFLLQFMSVCREKPESLPPLDQLGMERDHGSMGRGGSSRGGQRTGSQMGNPRGGAMGIGGIGAGGMGSFGSKNPVGMGSFGMGTFNRPAATSEERMAASRIGNMGNAFGSARNTPGMARTPSQSGPGGMNMMTPGMGRETSRAGSARGKRRGEPRGAPSSMGSGQLDPDVAPLELSANRWTPGVQSRRPGAIDESSPEYVERKVKGLLNKLTKEKFNSISDQILEWGNKSISENDGQTLRLVIKLIFEKAKDEQFWSSMYAELCHKLLETLSPEIKDEQVVSADGTPLAGGVLFRKYLLNRCQEDFERGWKNKEDASAAAKNKASEDEKNKAAHAEAVAAGKQVEEFKFSDEYYAEQAAKRQGLGLVKFVGELYKLDMLSLKIMNACIVKLLHNIVTPDEEDVESLCQLISTVGEKIQKTSQSAAGTLSIFISRMTEMKSSTHISSRMKFMLLEVIESYNNGWKSRAGQGQSGPMTIEEVHRQAAKEQADAARAAANIPMSRDQSMSRGGSRRGDQRSGFGGPPGASDAWQSVGNRPPPKAADMTGFGNIKSGGGPGPGSFGPASVFNRKNTKPKSGDVTPPNGPATTSANPFSALGMDDGSGEMSTGDDSGSAEAMPQRKRLVLQPRTVSSANVNESDAAEGSAAESAQGGLSKDEIDRKIKADLAEFWGEKGTVGTRNTDDAVSYFEGMPEEGRLELAKKLIDDVFRLSSAADTSLVTEAFTKAIAKDVLSAETVKNSLMPSIELLDDIAVDVPQAYAFAAQIIVAAKLSESDIDELADAIEVLGEVTPLPKDKLKAQVQKLQG